MTGYECQFTYADTVRDEWKAVRVVMLTVSIVPLIPIIARLVLSLKDMKEIAYKNLKVRFCVELCNPS